MPTDVKVVLLGTSGSGKSTLGNILLDLSADSNNWFREHNEIRQAYGCQKTHRYIGELSLTVVDTPGFFRNEASSAEGMWRDMTVAFDSTEGKVDVFLLVLNSEEEEMSTRFLKAFLEFFGEKAKENVLVVFTHNELKFDESSLRKIKVRHFANVTMYLGHDFPYFIWKRDENKETQRLELIKKIQTTKTRTGFNTDDFVHAQLSYAEGWIRQKIAMGISKSKLTRQKLMELGFPDVLSGKILTRYDPNSLDNLLEKIKKNR